MDKYVIGKVIGHGGFGITYIGWDSVLQRKVAVKEYFPSGVASRALPETEIKPFSGTLQKDFDYGLERYLEEARLVAKFNSHPNILSVLNFFRGNSTAYIVMEYLEGDTLERYLERMGGRLRFEDTLEILVPVMHALEEVHDSGVLHRDVSTDNIHIGIKKQVKLLDFGAARIALGERSRNLSVILKEGYAPPEQYRSKGKQGPWTDIYALGATIYRCITGQLPPPALDRMTEDELKPPLSLGVAMSLREEEALLKALAFSLDDRFQSMREFREAITQRSDSEPQSLHSLSALSAAATIPQIPTSHGRVQTEVPTVLASYTPPERTSAPEPQFFSACTAYEPQPAKTIPAWAFIAGGAAIAVLAFLMLRPSDSTGATAVVKQAAPVAVSQEPSKPSVASYEQLIENGQKLEKTEPAQALRAYQEAIAADSRKWEAQDLSGQVLLYGLSKSIEAGLYYRRSIDEGGMATFRVASQVGPGVLRFSKDALMFRDEKNSKPFSSKLAEIKEIRKMGPSLHLRLANGDSYEIVPTSNDKDGELDMMLQFATGK